MTAVTKFLTTLCIAAAAVGVGTTSVWAAPITFTFEATVRHTQNGDPAPITRGVPVFVGDRLRGSYTFDPDGEFWRTDGAALYWSAGTPYGMTVESVGSSATWRLRSRMALTIGLYDSSSTYSNSYVTTSSPATDTERFLLMEILYAGPEARVGTDLWLTPPPLDRLTIRQLVLERYGGTFPRIVAEITALDLAPTAVPEPAAAAYALLGLAAVLRRRLAA